MSTFPRQAIVLAAGFGTRLLPLTKRIPKPALPVGGIPLLFYNLMLLKDAGVREAVINLHHLPKVIRSLLQGSARLGLKLHFSLEPKILGTAGGIAQALAILKPRRTWVLNGDILTDLDLKAMARLHQKTGAEATLACVSPDRAQVHSFVESDGRGRIWRIAGEPRRVPDKRRLKKSIFSGIHLLEPRIFAGYPTGQFGCVIRQVYRPALEKGERLQAYLHRGAWWDLGSLTELKKVDQLLWKREAGEKIMELWERLTPRRARG